MTFMARRLYQKLVRDRIPLVIRAEGKTPKVRTLRVKEYDTALRMKLIEEAHECKDAQGREALIEELADLAEVTRALGFAHGIAKKEVTQAMQKKRKARGGFTERIFLIDITD